MVKNFFKNGSKILSKRQTTILSAAFVIMVMIALSRILGLVRNRVLANFFTAETLAVYFAAFRLPEVVFEVLVFGALSSAFIPTFTTYLSRAKKKEAWQVAAISLNFAILLFLILALVILFLARPIYRLIAPGFSFDQIETIVSLTRLLLLAQGLFVLSYFLTGVLESMQRFLAPAIAPIFYNLGIILGALLGAEKWGIYAPVIGAIVGAFLHFLIQVPVAIGLGFRPKLVFNLSHPGIKEIKRLALPRIIELSFLQVSKSMELFLASLTSVASYTYFTFATSLQLLPVSLFGVSIAKASLPTLSYHAARKDFVQLKETFIASFNEIVFLVMPFSVFLGTMRLPLVRLVFGASQFTWLATIQTGYVLSAFCLGIFAQALIYLLNRVFYALHEAKTAVKTSIAAIILNIILGVIFILVSKWPIWGLALSFSLAAIMQSIILLILLYRRLNGFAMKRISIPFVKVLFSSLTAGILMIISLKALDRTVFDTRYTINLILLMLVVGVIGLFAYLLVARLLRIKEIIVFVKLFTRLKSLGVKPAKVPEEKETFT